MRPSMFPKALRSNVAIILPLHQIVWFDTELTREISVKIKAMPLHEQFLGLSDIDEPCRKEPDGQNLGDREEGYDV
jgi:hypothetical protein